MGTDLIGFKPTGEVVYAERHGRKWLAPCARTVGVVELNAVPKRGQAAADPSKTWVLDVRTARVLSNTSLGDLIAAICRLVAIDDVGNKDAPSDGDSTSP